MPNDGFESAESIPAESEEEKPVEKAASLKQRLPQGRPQRRTAQVSAVPELLRRVALGASRQRLAQGEMFSIQALIPPGLHRSPHCGGVSFAN